MAQPLITDMSCLHRTTKAIEFDTRFGFQCDGCRDIGYGSCYNCTNGCDYQLHTECRNASPQASPLFEPQRSFFLQLQEMPPNTTKLCEACGMSVKGWRYDAILGSGVIHPCCMKQPYSTVVDGLGEFSLAKRLESIPCCYCKFKSLGEHLDGWAYVSVNHPLGFHVKCMKLKFCENWIKVRMSDEERKARLSLLNPCANPDSNKEVVPSSLISGTPSRNLLSPCLQPPITNMDCLHLSTEIIELDNRVTFTCDGCLEIGYGSCYICTNGCNYTLHMKCRTAHTASAVASHLFHPEQLFFLKVQETPNPTKQCEACGITVKGWRYETILGSTSIHPCCMKQPDSIEPDGVGKFALTKRLESIACCFCESKSLGVNLDGWAYVSVCHTVGFHVKCLKELMYEDWINARKLDIEREATGEVLVSSSSGTPSRHVVQHSQTVVPHPDPSYHRKRRFAKLAARVSAELLFSMATGDPISAISAISGLF